MKTSEYWIVFAGLALGIAVAVGMSTPPTERETVPTVESTSHYSAAVAEELSEALP